MKYKEGDRVLLHHPCTPNDDDEVGTVLGTDNDGHPRQLYVVEVDVPLDEYDDRLRGGVDEDQMSLITEEP